MAIEFEMESNVKEVQSAKDRAIEKFLTEAGLHLAGESQRELENNPRRIDTGNLRNSITSQVETAERAVYVGTVGTNVEYGIYVHEGTMYMAANRFLKNAFERNESQIQAKAKADLSDA